MKRYLKLVILILTILSLIGCAKRTPDEEAPSQPAPMKESTAPLLAEGETVTIDGVCEFHVEPITISETPELYYDAESGKTYVDFCITYTNLADYIVGANNIMTGTLIYSGQYEYDGVDVAAEEDGLSLSPAHWIELSPSDTRQVHYFFTVPKILQDDNRMVELNMRIGENDYRIIVREGEKGTISTSENDTGSDKTSGEVKVGEVVTTDNAQFYVEHAEFAKEVTPPSLGSAYNYYAAEDGNVFVDFCIAYTNLSAENITAHKAVSATLEQADAQTTVTEQSERSMFDYSNLVNIIPLCTEYVHYIFQVPEELENSGEAVTISFKIDGNRYTYSVK